MFKMLFNLNIIVLSLSIMGRPLAVGSSKSGYYILFKMYNIIYNYLGNTETQQKNVIRHSGELLKILIVCFK